MLKIEQTEFWTETTSARVRGTATPVPSAVEDYFLDEVSDAELVDEVEALDAIVLPDPEASPRLLDISESIDTIERRHRQEEPDEDRGPASQGDPRPAGEPEPSPRPMGTLARTTYAQQDAPKPRFSMARFLRLTGSLDAVDDRQHWYELPTRRFRAIFTLAARRPRLSPDFLKDMRSPPRGVACCKYSRPEGWLLQK